MQAVTVDRTGRDDADRDPGRTARDGPEELLPQRRVDLLGVVQESKGPDGVLAEALVIQEDARGNKRSGEAATPGLVCARDEAHPEPAVEGQQFSPRTAHGRHGREDSA